MLFGIMFLVNPHMAGYVVGFEEGLLDISLEIPFSFFLGAIAASFICGILVIIGGVMVRTRHQSHVAWGIIIVVFSVLSFFGLGGFLIGTILGIIGGIWAIVWKPPVGLSASPSQPA